MSFASSGLGAGLELNWSGASRGAEKLLLARWGGSFIERNSTWLDSFDCNSNAIAYDRDWLRDFREKLNAFTRLIIEWSSLRVNSS